MPLMSLKQFKHNAEEIAGSLPTELFSRLNGGIIVEPSIREEGDYIIMGEYLEDPGLGNLIILYYGSFREMLGSAPFEEWNEEIRETMIHELRHHVESLAGVDDLSVEESQVLQEDSSA